MRHSFLKLVNSSLGRKFVMSLTGLSLVGFIINHLVANLKLLAPSAEPYNRFVYDLHSWGGLLIAAEIGLALAILLHIVTAISVTRQNKSARSQSYGHGLVTKGGPSRNSLMSRNMILSGMVLGIFMLIHVIQFRFGPGVAEGYVTAISGHDSRDLHRLVVETFQNPLWVVFYLSVMVFLLAHFRHGFWSAFQSLGIAFPRFTRQLHLLGLMIGLVLAVGFLLIPIWIYLDLGSHVWGVFPADGGY